MNEKCCELLKEDIDISLRKQSGHFVCGPHYKTLHNVTFYYGSYSELKCFWKTLPQCIPFTQDTLRSGEGQGMYVMLLKMWSADR
jgi:hypothetical protein